MHSIKIIVLAIITSGVISACGGIPAAYRGKYLDPATGTKLELTRSSGTFESNGRALSAQTEVLDFEKLLAAETGIYMDQDPNDAKYFKIYWIHPNITTRQEAAGLVWYQAEILYTAMDSTREQPVDQILIIYSKDGWIMLDLVRKKPQIGWSANPASYDMRRLEN